jgi:hypothetical protein
MPLKIWRIVLLASAVIYHARHYWMEQEFVLDLISCQRRSLVVSERPGQEKDSRPAILASVAGGFGKKVGSTGRIRRVYINGVSSPWSWHLDQPSSRKISQVEVEMREEHA